MISKVTQFVSRLADRNSFVTARSAAPVLVIFPKLLMSNNAYRTGNHVRPSEKCNMFRGVEENVNMAT